MTSFIVIGGGIAGVSAAARLSEHAQVVVLEQEDALAYHASGRSAAMFEENYGAPSTLALNRASAEYHHTNNGGYLTPRGLMLIAGEQDLAQFNADIDTLHLARISIDEARDMVPILNPKTVTLAARHDAALDLDTDRMVQDFARVVRANGGQILTRKPVSAIQRTDTGWRVDASGDVFEADMLINAAGPWADVVADLAGIRPIGITPLRRSMARLPAPGGHDLRHWPMLMGVGETWYAKPDAGKLLVSPAEEDLVPPHDAYADDMVLAEGLARYEQMVTEPVTRVETNWAGLRSFAPDRALVLGPDPDNSGFVWCAGQGGYGFQTAPAGSQLVADLALGRPTSLPADVISMLSPRRFR
ncbi:FAD-dependent oxidoreductase [Aliisedimentitalea scapharcae]|uniref:FAD-dependent oxidoreductase n=1 Tax=Aliisedimentitalea scapharcae TaxID=1524259 RepID=A0ABZ2XPM4_9RHOB